MVKQFLIFGFLTTICTFLIQSLQITNAQGQEMLYRTHLPAGTQKIKVSKWANGVYDALFKEGEYVFKASFSIIR